MKILNVIIDTSGYPMMSKEEVEIIDKLIEERQPKYCLEWGVGNSTVYFPKKHRCIKLWLSIEHNGHYIDYFKDKVSDNTTMIWIDNVDKVSYPDCVKMNSEKYDFILIDGNQREECLEVAYKVAKKGAIILLHDSGRQAYKKFIEKYNHKKLSDGEIPDGKGFYAHRGLTLFIK